MLDYIKNPDTWMTIIAVVISIIALFQTAKQTKLSNKQQLFDRRLENYLFLKDLLILYSKNRKIVINNPDICTDLEIPFILLTNCSFLESMALVLNNDNFKDDRKVFLTKCETLEKNAIEIELIWDDEKGKLAGNFVKAYKEVLKSMYQQHIMLYHLKSENERTPMLLEEFQDRAKNEAEKLKLFEHIETLEKFYQIICSEKIEERIVKSIKL